MRLLVVSRGVVPISPGCGGAELVAYQLAKTMAEAGNEVTLVADVDDKVFGPVPGLTLVSVSTPLLEFVRRFSRGFFSWILQHLVGNIGAAWRVRRLFKEGARFDVIHTHGNLSTVLISLISRAPVVYTEHDATPWMCRYRRWWERVIRKAIYGVVNGAAFRRAHKVITLFEGLASEIRHRWKIPAEKVGLIRNGTDIELFCPEASDGRGVRDLLGLDRYCLFVGRLTPRKSPDLLLDAIAEAAELPCVIVGDGPMRKKLERRARELRIPDKVRFLGNTSPEQLRRLYAEAELLILPSFSEGSPLVVLEAMASGTPVLATRVAGLPGLIEDWETGFLVKPGDVGQLATAIRFLARDEGLRERMGRNAREKAARHHHWPDIARQYLTLFASLDPLTIRLSEQVAKEQLVDETL